MPAVRVRVRVRVGLGLRRHTQRSMPAVRLFSILIIIIIMRWNMSGPCALGLQAGDVKKNYKKDKTTNSVSYSISAPNPLMMKGCYGECYGNCHTLTSPGYHSDLLSTRKADFC
jgi:hypothetical protein